MGIRAQKRLCVIQPERSFKEMTSKKCLERRFAKQEEEKYITKQILWELPNQNSGKMKERLRLVAIKVANEEKDRAAAKLITASSTVRAAHLRKWESNSSDDDNLSDKNHDSLIDLHLRRAAYELHSMTSF